MKFQVLYQSTSQKASNIYKQLGKPSDFLTLLWVKGESDGAWPNFTSPSFLISRVPLPRKILFAFPSPSLQHDFIIWKMSREKTTFFAVQWRVCCCPSNTRGTWSGAIKAFHLSHSTHSLNVQEGESPHIAQGEHGAHDESPNENARTCTLPHTI